MAKALVFIVILLALLLEKIACQTPPDLPESGEPLLSIFHTFFQQVLGSFLMGHYQTYLKYFPLVWVMDRTQRTFCGVRVLIPRLYYLGCFQMVLY